MADPRCFTNAGPFSVAEIAQRSGAELAGAPLETASSDQLSFLYNSQYINKFLATESGAIIVAPKLVTGTTKNDRGAGIDRHRLGHDD
jgi:UDP-3-O-[3-hydroxymyristoyl] glucosamine N-acyltransferase